MKRSGLAARLIRARNDTERKQLIVAHAAIADARLAREIANQCYRVWASEPAGAQKAAAAMKILVEFSADGETKALTFWVDGVADITRGKLESAMANLDSASKLLVRLGREHESAQPQVAKLIALAMLGRYDQARRTGEKALKIFQTYGDQLAAGKIEMNLSNIVSRHDQYRLAEHYCLSAYRRFRRLGERSWQTMAENGLANTYAELNDFRRAEEFYERALKNARAARMHVTVAEIEASMGNLALFRGRYAEALRWLELSRQKYEKLGMPHQTAVAELEIADIYSELNLAAEAKEIYQRIVTVLHRLKLRAEEARARANLGRVLITGGSLRQAGRELKRAAQLFGDEKNFTAAASVDLRRASLELSQGNLAAALDIANTASTTLHHSENARLRLSALWLRGEIFSKLGQAREATSLLNAARKQALKLEQTAIARAAMNSLGVLAAQHGNAREAEKLFVASINAAETARAPLPGEEFRIAFMSKTLAPYENLWRLYVAAGNSEKAFVIVERARSRSLLDAVGSAKRGASNTAAAKIREELNWFYSRATRAEDAEAARLQKDIREREKKLTALELRNQSTTRAGTTSDGREIDVRALQAQLGKGRALVEFVEHAGTYSAFVVTDDRIEYVDEIAAETEILSLLEGLHFQFGSLRFGNDVIREFAAQLKTRADSYLQKLYDELLRPLASMVRERDLVIVPSGVLNYVPFHALFDEARYAIESREIVYSPSAAIWKELNSRRRRVPQNALLMAYADERIPLVNSEVTNVAKILPNSVKFVGRQATFSAFQDNAPRFDLIHLACHGQFRPDNPMFSSLHLADGWVTVRDVTANRLRAELVTLSACETGLSKILPGEEILGLARGFLSAGAKSLVLTLWTVNDVATAGLMEDVYGNLQRGKTIAASLRVAQINLIKRGEHPYFWSPFFVIG
jgi:CHAT domain-containing protein